MECLRNQGEDWLEKTLKKMTNIQRVDSMEASGKGVWITLYLVIIIFLYSCNNNGGGNNPANMGSVSDTAKIVFNEYEHDFGKITAGEKVAYIFTFENKGTGPLVISSAITSCGCTVSRYDRKPVLPGEKGTVEVVFDSSGRNGKQTKTITIKSNASKPVVLLKISGEITNNNNN